MKVIRRLTSGEIGALVAVCAVAVVLVARGQGMFSPGPLNAESRGNIKLGGVSSHAEIEKNCSACHVSPWSSKTMADRCIDCHTDIGKQLDAHGPMHGKLADGSQCRTCHTEHGGPHGVLTRMDKFDHDYTAFILTGKHQLVDCKSCHVDNVFKGTSQTCVSCHAEPPVPKIHKGRFGTSCGQCHTTNTWKDANLSLSALTHFDHDFTGYKLTGKHISADCKSCHVNNVFKGTPQSCVSCHVSPPVPQKHKANYGSNCMQCHKTDTWTGATFKHPDFSITHGSKKNANTCATCHSDANNFKAYTCYNCHEHQPQKIERIHAKRNIANLQECAHCHGRKNRRAQGDDDGREIAICQNCPEPRDLLSAPTKLLFGKVAPRQPALGAKPYEPVGGAIIERILPRSTGQGPDQFALDRLGIAGVVKAGACQHVRLVSSVFTYAPIFTIESSTRERERSPPSMVDIYAAAE